jgi:hypothetical protein
MRMATTWSFSASTFPEPQSGRRNTGARGIRAPGLLVSLSPCLLSLIEGLVRSFTMITEARSGTSATNDTSAKPAPDGPLPAPILVTGSPHGRAIKPLEQRTPPGWSGNQASCLRQEPDERGLGALALRRPPCLKSVSAQRWGKRGEERERHRTANRQNFPRLQGFSHLGDSSGRLMGIAEANDRPEEFRSQEPGLTRPGRILGCPGHPTRPGRARRPGPLARSARWKFPRPPGSGGGRGLSEGRISRRPAVAGQGVDSAN